MWSRTLIASRSMAVRAARTQARAFSRPAALKADLVQELYLKELKAYKVPPTKASDAEGSVQKFRVPATPASPEESNLASELSDYENQAVEVEAGSSAEGAPETQEKSWYDEDLFEDWPEEARPKDN